MLAALILWPFARPRLRGRSRADLGAAVALGACSGLLTLSFFEAIARIPLGVAVTIEFLGPLGVALAGSRHARDVPGCCSRARASRCSRSATGRVSRSTPPVCCSRAIAGACWAGYIVLTKRVGARWAGFEGLSVSLAVAALVTLPVGVASAGSELLAPEVLLAGLGLALLIPLLPYAFELIALRRLPTAAVRRDHEPRAGDRGAARLRDPRPGPRGRAAWSRSRWSRGERRRDAQRARRAG